MVICIASGKGGTGKASVATKLTRVFLKGEGFAVKAF
jgi:MinD superfamily P-loop ATPase